MITSQSKVRFAVERRAFHAALIKNVLRLDAGVASNADKGNKTSKEIALSIATLIGLEVEGAKLAGQTAGNQFEAETATFVRQTFLKLNHLRPGQWVINKIGEAENEEPSGLDHQGVNKIAKFEQYKHLIAIAEAAKQNPELAASLGSDYLIKPDIVVYRRLESDDKINLHESLVDGTVARLSSLRQSNGGAPLLHASISCKWTIRSDRSQNSRSEALNLIRNRRGKLPHVVVVTGEPLPSRLASVALGSGDIDCVYHFALPELQQTVRQLGLGDSEEALDIMVKGKRLKDISDLPLDLAV